MAKRANVDDYKHKDKRKNNPPAGMSINEPVKREQKKYEYDPNLDPALYWTGKAEHTSFDVDTTSLHVHERISTKAIIRAVERREIQRDMFNDPDLPLSKKLEFYQHDIDWTNRIILGDSLVVMNSLLEKEMMAGKIQCVYMDPPYGINYNSNFQPNISNMNVKATNDESLSREPEQIRAYRDTWTLGIHSFLTYLKDRILLSKELLTEEGSIFVQISDENIHLVRLILDEVFGKDNFIALIPFRKKTMPFGTTYLEQMSDFIIWYGKDKVNKKTKYNPLYIPQNVEGEFHHCWYELPDKTRHRMTKEQLYNHKLLPKDARVYRLKSLEPSGKMDSGMFEYEFKGKKYHHPKNGYGTTLDGMNNLKKLDRLQPEGRRLNFILYADENPAANLTSPWNDTVGADNKQYVVQTNTEVIKRCLLMTTDPGDVVFDPTCGSGTTAYVAESWGRRWITCDTSRVAIAIAKQRILTSVFQYYKYRDNELGIKGGFIYKSVPHITLKSLAKGLPPNAKTLIDKPEINKKITRVSGPFTFEMLPSYTEQEIKNPNEQVDDSDFIGNMIDLLRTT